MPSDKRGSALGRLRMWLHIDDSSSLYVFSEFRMARFFRIRMWLRMARSRQSKACGDSIRILKWSATYQLASRRSLGFDFTDWFAPFFFFSVPSPSRILFVIWPAWSLSIMDGFSCTITYILPISFFFFWGGGGLHHRSVVKMASIEFWVNWHGAHGPTFQWNVKFDAFSGNCQRLIKFIKCAI